MPRTRRVLLLIPLLLLLFVLVTLRWVHQPVSTWSHGGHWRFTNTTAEHAVKIFSNRNFQRASEKLILLWTGYFGHRQWDFREHFLDTCQSKCRVTTDRQQLARSDAVLFNSRDVEGVKQLPKYRRPDQVWVLHNSEPPYYIFMNMKEYNGVFNWTSWYRQDADVYSPYGNFVKGARPDPLPNYFAIKKKFAYWAASSCTDRARRYRVVSELQKHMDIDTYGSCGRLVCEKRSWKCSSLFARYKFAFALENGHCKDYVTEKFWGALSKEQIPVVLGGANYKAIAPPGSYIDIRDFSSAGALAKYLKLVGSDETLYNSYFSWKRHYQLTEWQVVDWCKLCVELHADRKSVQVYDDLLAWVQADTCKLYTLLDQIDDNLARVWYLLGG